MNEWDEFNDFSSTTPTKHRVGSGSWHLPLTLIAFVLVAGLSFFISYLTRNIENRSIIIIAVTFGIPVGAMFLAALIMELGSRPMLPTTSRSAQVKVAALAVAGTILVGGVCDAIYLYGGFSGDVADDLVFLIYEDDVSGNTEIDRAAVDVIESLKKQTRGNLNVSVYQFDTKYWTAGISVNTYVPLHSLSDSHMQQIRSVLIEGNKPNQIDYGISQAYDAVERNHSDRHTRIIVIEPGGLHYNGDLEVDTKRLAACNTSLCILGESTDENMKNMVLATGGIHVDRSQFSEFAEGMKLVCVRDGDMIRANTTSAFILTGIMMLLEGLVIGLGMWLLLSVRGQFRLQIVLSPLFSIAAFVMLKMIGPILFIDQWILEGLSFSLLGLVFMRRNLITHHTGKKSSSTASTYGGEDLQDDSF